MARPARDGAPSLCVTRSPGVCRCRGSRRACCNLRSNRSWAVRGFQNSPFQWALPQASAQVEPRFGPVLPGECCACCRWLNRCFPTRAIAFAVRRCARGHAPARRAQAEAFPAVHSQGDGHGGAPARRHGCMACRALSREHMPWPGRQGLGVGQHAAAHPPAARFRQPTPRTAGRSVSLRTWRQSRPSAESSVKLPIGTRSG
ncbi:MAG: hypothetical protein RL385_3444 [Pseudomonadota bacterium]